MPVFPKKEADVAALAETVIAGVTAHPEDFPSIDPLELQGVLDSYRQMKTNATEAYSRAKTAVTVKDGSLDGLVEDMKNTLKRAEADTSNDADKLAEIGWGPKAIPQPLAAPNSPTALRSIAEGQSTLSIDWQKPESGGAVWYYIVERRQQVEGGGFGQWTFAANCYNCDANLTEQPLNVKLEYRVKAANKTGESAPSNSITVTLP